MLLFAMETKYTENFQSFSGLQISVYTTKYIASLSTIIVKNFKIIVPFRDRE